MKPEKMSKIAITAPRSRLEDVVDSLYDLGLMDLDNYQGELENGEPLEGSDELSETLVSLRSILSSFDVEETEEATVGEVKEKIPQINSEVQNAESKIKSLESRIENLKELKKSIRPFEGAAVDIQSLKDTESLEFKGLKFDEQEFAKEYGRSNYEVYSGKEASILVYRASDSKKVSQVLESVNHEEVEVPDIDGKPSENIREIESEIEGMKEQIETAKKSIKSLEREWGPKLKHVEEYLTSKVEKSEAPLKFGMTSKSFHVEGWVPTENVQRLRNRLESVTENSVHVEEIEGENPPVKYNNNSIVQPFESLTDLMSRPKYGEIDPSFMIFLTFPLFFGLMIGDAGYGLSMSLVFYGAMKLFPQASDLFKALLWTAGSTFVFGLIYGEFFGFQFYESPLYRADLWTEIFYLTIGIGVAHVNLGLLIGAYNEYVHHGLMEAIFAKGSWMLLQIAGAAGYLINLGYGSVPGLATFSALAAPTILMMYKAEGIEAVVEIPSLLTNILSYLRLFGVCMAAYTLAGAVNAMAGPALASGTALGMIGGTVILIVGHLLLTFIKIMEGFLQGIRLHYVEQFNWFYSGGGRKYSPFGGGD